MSILADFPGKRERKRLRIAGEVKSTAAATSLNPAHPWARCFPEMLRTFCGQTGDYPQSSDPVDLTTATWQRRASPSHVPTIVQAAVAISSNSLQIFGDVF